MLMNVIAQFLVYPFWNQVLGKEAYGNIVYLLAIMNTMAISVGSGINYARMKQSAEEMTHNWAYNRLMFLGTLSALCLLTVLQCVGLLHLDLQNFVLFCFLTVLTTWRFYGDVEYRLRINYKGYFCYYLLIGLGYIFGIFLFYLSHLWPLALIPGEIAGLVLVAVKGTVFRRDSKRVAFTLTLKVAALFVGSNVLSNLIFNGDRIVLRLFAGGTAVSIYYIATLFGKTMTLVTTPLNGVLVGYLSKYDGQLTHKMMNRVFGITMIATMVATAACLAASWVVLPHLYPNEYGMTAPYLLIGTAAQVFYFVGNVLIASVLLRFTPARNQMLVSGIYAAVFIVICVPIARLRGIAGFCWALFVVNLLRYVLCLALGYSKCER